MNLQQIKEAVNAGKTVHWASPGYIVKKYKEEYYILCPANGNTIGLTWRDGATLNGKENEFYLASN